jgi:hypothetical protein
MRITTIMLKTSIGAGCRGLGVTYMLVKLSGFLKKRLTSNRITCLRFTRHRLPAWASSVTRHRATRYPLPATRYRPPCRPPPATRYRLPCRPLPATVPPATRYRPPCRPPPATGPGFIGHPLPATGHPLPATRYRPPATRHRPPCHVCTPASEKRGGGICPRKAGLVNLYM